MPVLITNSALRDFAIPMNDSQHVVLAAAVPRHLAAWARGCCYLHAGNTRQALKDAQAAMAYAAAAAAASTRRTARADKPTATAAQPSSNATPTHCTVSSTAGSSSVLQAQPTKPATAAAAAVAAPACSWVPALLLAADAYAALQLWPQAVVHCAAAVLQAPGQAAAAAAAERLAVMARQLLPEQAVAFRTGGLAGLLQQLQLEAEMKLPEVLRPRPKW
jgi:hypothetical protein